MEVGDKQMIKYNTKEAFHQQTKPDIIFNNRSKEYLPKNIKNAVTTEQACLSHIVSASQFSEQLQDNKKQYNLFLERRSKSHKINQQKINRGKLKNEVMKRRQFRTNKMDLLVILPNKNEKNQSNINRHNESCFDGMLMNNSSSPKLNQLNAQQSNQSNTQKKDQSKLNVRGDIAIGKMRLLAHKSKLSPIRQTNKDNRQAREMHHSQQRLNNINKMESTCFKKFMKEKEQSIKEQQFITPQRNKLSPNFEKYIRIPEQGHPVNLMNIQSIVPNISIAEKLSIHIQSKEKRRNTEASLDTAEEFYKITQNNFGTIYDKKFISNVESAGIQLNFHTNKQRIKKYPQKLKASQWKKKVLLSNLTKFVIPFQTYYYRDMLWKVNYSNRLFVEPPLQYEHRLKAYVGKGNNSSMVRGLISRRYWFAITDRLQQANFVWTQLKQFRYFSIQKGQQLYNCEKRGGYAIKSLLLAADIKQLKAYCQRNKGMQEHSDQRMLPRLKCFNYSQVIRGANIKQGRLHNHLINNYIISNKKSLFRVLNSYYKHHNIDPFNIIPITYHVTKGIEDPTFLSFQRNYHQQAKLIRKGQSNRRNYWIVKPGQNSNRGNGIKLCFKLSQIKAIVREKGTWGDGSQKTHIIQSYIQNPLLYYKRKFDLRHYMLMTCINGTIKGYWYSDGYVRTTSSEYTLQFNGSNVHLTNDAIQKYLPNYGKFQKGNKLSYDQLDAYIRKKPGNNGFYTHIYPQMKKIAIDIMKGSANYLDPNRLSNNFELFGLDFMIDSSFSVWLIQVNSNPCLQLSCPLLSSIIPNLIENVLQLTMDAHYPPAVRYSAKIPRYLGKTQDLNKFELVFDERAQQLLSFDEDILDSSLLQEQDDQFEDNNSQWEDNV